MEYILYYNANWFYCLNLIVSNNIRTIVDAELPTVTSFKYIGSLFTNEGGSQADVNNMIIIGWMKWMEVYEVMCARTMALELKDNVLNTIIRPSVTWF